MPVNTLAVRIAMISVHDDSDMFGAGEWHPILLGRDPSADVTYAPRWIVGGAIIAALALAAVGTGRSED